MYMRVFLIWINRRCGRVVFRPRDIAWKVYFYVFHWILHHSLFSSVLPLSQELRTETNTFWSIEDCGCSQKGSGSLGIGSCTHGTLGDAWLWYEASNLFVPYLLKKQDSLSPCSESKPFEQTLFCQWSPLMCSERQKWLPRFSRL